MEQSASGNDGIHRSPFLELIGGIANNQRYPNQLIINREAVAHKLLFAQVFAVVGADDDQGIVEASGLLEPVKELTEHGILVGHFGIVHAVQGLLLVIIQRPGEGSQPAVYVTVESL